MENFKFREAVKWGLKIFTPNWHGRELGNFPKIVVFPLNISATAKAGDFKFGVPLGFAKGHHKITPRVKVGVALG